jgi:hypothetical protein
MGAIKALFDSAYADGIRPPKASIRTLGQMIDGRLGGFISLAECGATLDGTTDDSSAWDVALAAFSANGAGIASGGIYVPGPTAISRPITYAGATNYALRIFGVGARSEGVINGSAIRWIGTAGGSMLICDGGVLEVDGVNFDCGGYAGLKNCIHFTSSATYTNATTNTIAAGANRSVAVSSTTGLSAGAALGVGKGTSDYEVVYVKSVSDATHFVADFLRSHSVGATVGASAVNPGGQVLNCSFTVPEGADSAGVLAGNLISATPQISELLLDRNVFRGHGTAGSAYAGFRVIGGGNAKDYYIRRLQAYSLKRPIAFEGDVHVVQIEGAQFEDTTDACVYAHGIMSLHMSSAETESPTHLHRLLDGSEGVNFENTATLVGCAFEGTPPADGYLIKHGGSLVLLGNHLGGPTGAAIAAKIRCGNVNGVTTGINPSSIISLGNYYGTVGLADTVFYDSSDNAMNFDDFGISMERQRLVSLGDHGDAGALPNRVGGLASPGISASIQTPASGVTYAFLGQAAVGRNKAVVPYTAFQTGGLTKDLLLFTLPAATKIVGIWAVTNPKFAGPAGTLNLRVGITSGGQELLVDHDVKTATITKPAADGDLGTSINRANAVMGGCVGAGSVFVRLTSSSGNLSGLNAGSVSVIVVLERAD